MINLINKIISYFKKLNTQYEVIIEYNYDRYRDSIFTNECIKSNLSLIGIRYCYGYIGEENKLYVLVGREKKRQNNLDKTLSILKRYHEVKNIKCSEFVEVPKERIK